MSEILRSSQYIFVYVCNRKEVKIPPKGEEGQGLCYPRQAISSQRQSP